MPEPQALQRDSSLPTVTVIIPVYNDLARLRTCLDLLARQDYPADRYEVIVVDNASSQDLRPAVPDDARFTMIYEGRRGSYAARNAAITRATGEVFAFTDSDCLPHLNWLSEGVRALYGPQLPDAVGGAINLVFSKGDQPSTAPEYFDALDGFPQQHFIEYYPFAATANMLVSAQTFHAVGPFDAELQSAGDRDWGMRLAATGRRFAYAPDATVDHPARASWSELTKKSVRIARGMADLEDEQGRREVLVGLSNEIRGIPNFWRQVRHMDTLPSMNAKLRCALAVTYVRGLRTAIRTDRLLRREISARRTARVKA